MYERPIGQYLFQLNAQTTDVNVDSSITRAKRFAPDGLVKLFAADDPAIVACQFYKQPKLTDREMERNSSGRRQALSRVQLKRAEAEDADRSLSISGFRLMQSHASQFDLCELATLYRGVKPL